MTKKILVVGGCGAVGSAVVAGIRARGDDAAVFDLPKSLERLRDADVLNFPVDVRDRASVRSAYENLGNAWGRLDGLVYTSGFANSPPTPAENLTDSEWRDVLDVNLFGAFLVATCGRTLLLEGQQSSIVFVSSSMAFGPVPGFAPYIASKAGLIGLTRALALEFSPKVRVNVIAPSAMETPFLAGGTGRVEDEAIPGWFDARMMSSQIPLGRLATPQDCAGAIDFLLDERSSFITGQVITLNGGKQMR
ncbi:SDR family NAD(P)-dependent oxidoreductase [Paraburkholderia sp.]|uniref:SDR family NAD(P)-dependent oxidoreductase n=1 Tax=Paraburkholderia sp. TaxID=1926495 RepID=UPI003C7C17E9